MEVRSRQQPSHTALTVKFYGRPKSGTHEAVVLAPMASKMADALQSLFDGVDILPRRIDVCTREQQPYYLYVESVVVERKGREEWQEVLPSFVIIDELTESGTTPRKLG